MKRTISLVIALIMVLSVLTACVDNKPKETTTPTESTKTQETTPTTDVVPTTEPVTEVEEYTVPTEMPEKKALTEAEQAGVDKMNTQKAKMDKDHFGEVVFMDPISPVSSIEYYPTVGQHPRVCVNPTTLLETYAKLHLKSNASAYSSYSKNKEKSDVSESVIEAKAFAYLVEGDTYKGYEAIYLYEKLLASIPLCPEKHENNDDDTRGKGGYINLGAKVYDWCYDLLTEEDKKMIYAGCQNILGPYMEIGFPPAAESQSTISSHSSEAQLLQNWLALAIAVYDDYPNAYDYIGSRLFAEYIPFRNYYYSSNFIHQGTSYGSYRFGFDLYSDWLMQAMTGGEHVYINNIQNIMTSWGYLIRPDGWLMRLGDDGKQSRFENIRKDVTIIANLYKNRYAKALFDRYTSNGGYALSACEYLIIHDPSVQAGSFDELPLAIYNGSPVGQIIARTGWDMDDINSDDITVIMRIGETYVTNHDHYDAGSFQIYYKGSLAIDSGSENMSKYMVGTVAHNTLLVGTEDDFKTTSYGGQYIFDSECHDWSTWNKKANLKRRVSNEVIAEEISASNTKLDYAYITGDLSNSYDGAQEVLRSMLFVPVENNKDVKGLFFVFDKLTTKTADYKKVFLLHMREEPSIVGNKIYITVEDGDYNGRLVDQVLELNGQTVEFETIGGPGKNEWLINNNYGDKIDYSDHIDKGWGRIEVSTTGNKTSYFFNVMTIGDANNSKVPEATLYETETHAASKILDTVAIFNKDFYPTEDSFSINIASNEAELTYYVTGVIDGEWQITVGGKTISATATEDGYMLVFKAPAGELTFTKK